MEQQARGARVLSAGALRALAAARDGPHAHDQLAVVDGLRNVVVGAGSEAGEAILHGTGAAQEDDRDVVAALFADDATGLVSGHAGEAEVEQDEVIGLGLQRVQALLRGRDGGDAEALQLEARGDDVGDVGVILDHQHAERARPHHVARDIRLYHRPHTSNPGRAFHTGSVATGGVSLCRGIP